MSKYIMYKYLCKPCTAVAQEFVELFIALMIFIAFLWEKWPLPVCCVSAGGGAFFYRPNLVVWWPTFRCIMLTGQKAFCWPTLWNLSSLTGHNFTYVLCVCLEGFCFAFFAICWPAIIAQKVFAYRLLSCSTMQWNQIISKWA